MATKQKPEVKYADQIGIFSAICHELHTQGIEDLNARQSNAIIEAANIVVAAFAKPDIVVFDAMGLQAWLLSDETGMSSKFMASVLSGSLNREYAYPLDSADFGRCLGLLRAVPEFRARVQEMKSFGNEWNVLVQVWDEATRAYESGDKKRCNAIVYKALKVGQPA